MPTFNYGFTRNGSFDVQADVSEVGQLTEYFRKNVCHWRTPTPVFSVAGVGAGPSLELGSEVDPFGPQSSFGQLVRADGVIVFYGAPFSTATFIHHAERVSGGPRYRYDKRFPGTVVLHDGSRRPTTLVYHVRPLGMTLEYDWDSLLADLLEQGVGRINASRMGRVMAFSARALVSFWVHRLEQDPLYLLDDESREWVDPRLKSLGRRFELADFEPDRGTAGRTQSLG